MSRPSGWTLERYRPLLRLQARQLQLNPRLKLLCGDSSDQAQDAYSRAVERFEQFRGTSEGELVRWLQRILANLARDNIAQQHRGAARLQSLEHEVAESTVRLDAFLAAEQSTPSEQAERQERLVKLAAALDQLPQDQPPPSARPAHPHLLDQGRRAQATTVPGSPHTTSWDA
jgi:RNA polymerase sigma-70 factor (ECF subfamily)